MGGQGGCERRSKVFVKIQKKKFFLAEGGGVGSGGGVGLGGQGGCEWRSKVFVKIQKKKKIGGGGSGRGKGGGVRSGVGVGEVRVARFGVGG